MAFLRSNRCSACRSHRGNRFCLRIGKEICWHCCNEKRIDLKCSESCSYSLRKVENSDVFFEYKSKVDSRAEFSDLTKNQVKAWCRKSQEIFGDKIPLKMSETNEGRNELEEFFGQFPLEKTESIRYLKQELKLTDLKYIPQADSYEEVAAKFLDKIIEQDWRSTIDFLYRSGQYEDEKYLENYISRLSKNKKIIKIKTYDLIASAISENRKLGLVFFEVNGKLDLTISLISENDLWKIEKKMFGKPELYNGEKDVHQQIAVLLSKNELGNAYEQLQKYSKIYIDSADLKYYWGLYYTFNKNNEKAKTFFFDAIEIDPDFTEAKYNYAVILHAEKEIGEAKNLYKEILEISPDEPKTLNNLASIYIEEENFAEAKKLLKRCLKIAPEFEIAKKNLERIER